MIGSGSGIARGYNNTGDQTDLVFLQIDQYGNLTTPHGSCSDIAEYIPGEEGLDPGTIVAPDPANSEYVIKSWEAYQPSAIGIVSTKAFLINDKSKGNVALALAGRVPLKVTSRNGPIKIGTPITTSIIPGVGMKATKAGKIIGRALELFDPENGIGLDRTYSCVTPSGEEATCGYILAFVETSWYDPDVYLTDTGSIKIVQEASESAQQASGSAKLRVSYILQKAGKIIERIGVFSELVAAKIRVGFLSSQEIESEKVVSPVVQTSEIRFTVPFPVILIPIHREKDPKGILRRRRLLRMTMCY